VSPTLRRKASGALLALATVTTLSASAAPPQNLPLSDVLHRLTRYLSDYAERLPATIATERYEQRVGRLASGERVVLESEFGIMRLAGTGGWLGLRDVLSVNGSAVADHQQRLQDLFTRPSKQGIQLARRIAMENARFNVGPLQRTINDPAVVLELLDGRNAARMRFTRTDDATVNGVPAWGIRYEERQRPTIIQTPDGRDLPAKGIAWVDPVTGRLVRAQVTIDRPTDHIGFISRLGFTAAIEVIFNDEPHIGFWVPSEMTEQYHGRDMSSCTGHATYTNYRTFGVETKILSP
jgi:hypothetical protein